MAEGAAIAKYGDLDEKDVDKIKAYSAASDNIGISLLKMYLWLTQVFF